jgi:tRNA G10  N-methylase Trm11
MARLAGQRAAEVIWDPFCGSGIELVERYRLGGVRGLYGTDVNGNAVTLASTNLTAAGIKPREMKLICRDFRDYEGIPGLGKNSVSLIMTNPPMGRRVPVADLRSLITDLFTVATEVLHPGGRLVFANPCPDVRLPRGLRRIFSRVVDLGGFQACLEHLVKTEDASFPPPKPARPSPRDRGRR